LTIENFPLTWREKFSDKYGGYFFIPLIPVIIALIPVIILVLLLGLFYENTVEKYFYKLIGEKRRPPKEKNSYPNLPSFISIKSMWDIDNIEDEMKNKYGFSDDEIEDMYLIKIESSVNIKGIGDHFFDPEIIAFNNDLFLQKVDLPEYNCNLCYIDVGNLTFHEFPNSSIKGHLKHSETPDSLTMNVRGYLTKCKLSVKYSS
jgi:hypothetical protein